jgi:hypothetical protein
MARAKRYEEGGETEDTTSEATPEPAKPSNFKSAFASARKAGDKTFEFNGKKYTTELASSTPAKVTDTGDETARLKARVPKPAPNYKNNPPSALSRAISSIRERGMKSNPDAYKSGGMTASRRADGIATKGKTRGKIC